MTRKFFLALLTFICCNCFMARSQSDCGMEFENKKVTVDQLLDRHTEAMGGLEAWQNLKSYELVQLGKNGGKTISSALKPDKMRYDFIRSNRKVIKAFDGKKGWLMRNGQYEDMRPGEEVEMKEEPEFYEELIFARQNRHQIELLGMEAESDQCLYKLQLIKSPTDTQTYWIDPDTYLIRMTGEYSEDSAHAGIYYKTSFSDFRSVEGLMFPFQMSLIPSNRPPIPFSYESIKLNVDFPDDFFTYQKE